MFTTAVHSIRTKENIFKTYNYFKNPLDKYGIYPLYYM